VEPGRASTTAEYVCMGRALADATTDVPGFSDPTALALLSRKARARVQRFRDRASLWQVLPRAHMTNLARMMAVRTVTIDDAIREAASPQLVILGAGLDGRAWRMRELATSIVFEVDHPDTQREKRARVAALSQTAREVRFVPVDFTRDSLDAALATAGHDPALPTTWIWEGVVMYLDRPAIDATLAVIDRRSALPSGSTARSGGAGPFDSHSAPRSRLVVAYHSPSWVLRVVGTIVRRVGEPLRSQFSADEMRALLALYRLDVVRDGSVAELGAAMSPAIARATRFVPHLRIATADRIQ
jgi:methyltransferase (TIGR00027 family)